VPLAAAIGLVRLAVADARRGVLMALLYGVNVAFAFGYNVGDAHVFFLPSHLMIALLVAATAGPSRDPGGASSASGPQLAMVSRVAIAVVLTAYAAVRAYRDFPALDRSADRRPTDVVAGLTSGLDDQHAVLLTDLNWQIANGLSYFAKVVRPEVVSARMPDVLLYAPALIRDNMAIDRRVVLTERARKEFADAYGPLMTTAADARTIAPPLTSIVGAQPAGTRYVLCLLRPSRDMTLDRRDLASTLDALGAGDAPIDEYVAVAGTIGRTPALVAAADRPFNRTVRLDGVDVEIRMESWLASDTIRRMGFGHVIANRQHTLIVERGVSFVAFDDRGRALTTTYRGNIFAPQPRYLCYR